MTSRNPSPTLIQCIPAMNVTHICIIFSCDRDESIYPSKHCHHDPRSR
jgi:hypothetical protein